MTTKIKRVDPRTDPSRRLAPGRPLGARNIIAEQTRQNFAHLVESNMAQLQKDILSLTPRDRCEVIIKLAAFVLPKLQAIDLKTATEPRVTVVTALTKLIEQNNNK